nr:Uncharacterised protein [Klebsiella pneumoniae]
MIQQALDNASGRSLSSLREKYRRGCLITPDLSVMWTPSARPRRRPGSCWQASPMTPSQFSTWLRSGLFMWRQLTLASAAILTMLEEYVAAGGGSRARELFLTRKVTACR